MMHNSNPRFFAFLSACALAAFTQNAHAQFVGDVFFSQPSITVPQGGTGDLSFSLFAGDKAFGVASTTLAFDPAQIAITAVTAVPAGAITPDIRWKVVGNVLSIVAVNGASLKAPIGTVVLAKITVRALGSAGVQTNISSNVSGAFATDRSAYRAGTGYGAEISIGSVLQTAAAVHPSAVASPSSELTTRALKLRPAGNQVTLFSYVGNGAFREQVVNVAAPSNSQRDAD